MEETTKRAIQQALIKLMQTCDVDRITVVDLAEQASVSRSTLYRYYDSVDAVLKDMEQEFFDELRRINHAFIASGIDYENACSSNSDPDKLFEYILANREFYLAVTGPHGDPQFIHRHNELIREYYGGKMMYERLVKENSDVVIEFALGGHNALVRYWLTERQDLTPAQVSHMLQRLMFLGFLR